LAVAKTGSGKTLAYLVPMLVHVLEQPALGKQDDGPIALVVCPTRELCHQIFTVATKICRPFNVNVLPVFGGVDPHELWKDIKHRQNEVVISTPGKLIEFLRKKAFSLSSRCTFLVVDEADRMFDLGFEYQLRSIVG
jgi:ATP-dependent RNA helicase DDX42